jgi:hypothetical protein
VREQKADDLVTGGRHVGGKGMRAVGQGDQLSLAERVGQPVRVLHRRDPVLLAVDHQRRRDDAREAGACLAGVPGRPVSLQPARFERVAQASRYVLTDAARVTVAGVSGIQVWHRGPQALFHRQVSEAA